MIGRGKSTDEKVFEEKAQQLYYANELKKSIADNQQKQKEEEKAQKELVKQQELTSQIIAEKVKKEEEEKDNQKYAPKNQFQEVLKNSVPEDEYRQTLDRDNAINDLQSKLLFSPTPTVTKPNAPKNKVVINPKKKSAVLPENPQLTKQEENRFKQLEATTFAGNYDASRAEDKYFDINSEYSAVNALANAGNAVLSLRGFVKGVGKATFSQLNPSNWDNDKTEKELDLLTTKRNLANKPVLENIENQYKAQQENFKKNIAPTLKPFDNKKYLKLQAKEAYLTDKEKVEYNQLKENQLVEDIQYHYSEINNEINNAKEPSFFNGFGEDRVQLYDLPRQLRAKELYDKFQNSQIKPTPIEQEWINTYKQLRNIKDNPLVDDAAYRTGKSVRGSADMMLEVALTEGAGRAIRAVAKTAIGAERFAAAGVKVGNAITETGKTVVDQTAKTLLQPSLYSSTVADNVNSMEVGKEFDAVTNKEKDVVLVNNKQKFKYKTAIVAQMSAMELEFNKLGQVKNPTQEQVAKMDKLSSTLSDMTKVYNNVFDQNGNIKTPDKSLEDVFLNKLSNALVERMTEKFVGTAVDNAVKKGFSKFAKSAVGSKLAATKPGEFVGKQLSNASKALTRFDQGVIQGNLLTKSVRQNATRTIDGVAGELGEEIVTNLTPTYGDDYNQKLKQLTSSQFYTDVLASTLIIGGTAAVGGSAIKSVGHNYNMLTDNKYKKDYKELKVKKKVFKESFDAIDKAITDEQVANHIMLTNSKTMYSEAEYRTAVNDLRNADKAGNGLTQEQRNEKANYIEKTSFFKNAVFALQIGQDKSFRNVLTRLSNNENVSEDTRKNAALAVQKLDTYKQIITKNADLINSADVVDLEMYNDHINSQLPEVDKKIQEHTVEFQKVLDQYDTANSTSINTEFLNTDTLNDQEQNNILATFLDKTKDNVAVNNYVNAQRTKNILQEQLSENNKQLEYETAPKNQYAIKQREKAKAVVQALQQMTIENAEATKEELNNIEAATPEVVQQINDAALPVVGNTVQENEFTLPTADQVDLSKLENDVRTSFNDNEEEIIDNNLIEDFLKVQEQENDLPGNNDSVSDEDNALADDINSFASPTEKSENPYKELFNRFKQSNPKAPLEVLLQMIVKRSNVDTFKKSYNKIVDAWNTVNPDNTVNNLQAETLLNELLPSENAMDEAMAKINNTIVEVITQESAPVIDAKIEEVANVPVVSNTVISTGKQIVDYVSRKFAIVGLKAAFLGLNYKDENGKKVTSSTQVNENALHFIDPRNFNEGSTVELVFNYDYLYTPDNNISIWNTDSNGKLVKHTFTVKQFLEKTFAGKTYDQLVNILRTNPKELLKNETFLKSIPVGIKNNGQYNTDNKVLDGGLNENSWFNENNVALKPSADGLSFNYEEQKARIDKNKEINLQTRKMIANSDSVSLQVIAKTNFAENKLLPETPEEKLKGYSFSFQSLFDSFKNIDATTDKQQLINDAKKNSSVGIIRNGKVVGSKNENGDKRIVIDNKEVSVDNITNYKDLVDRIAKDKGFDKLDGTVLMVTKNSTDASGKQLYKATMLISNHINKQKEFAVIQQIKYTLLDYGRILRGGTLANGNVATPNQLEKATNINKNLIKQFNLDLSIKDSLQNVLDMYCEQRKNTDKSLVQDDAKYRQDYKYEKASLKRAENLPNLMGHSSVQEFEQAFLNNKIQKTTYKDIVYSNFHTQHIFTAVTNTKGETIYTDNVQPVIVYSNEHLDNSQQVDKNNDAKVELTKLEKSTKLLEKQLQQSDNNIEKEKLIVAIEEKKKEVEEKKKEVSEIVEEKEEVITQRDFDTNDLFNVTKRILYNALAKVDTSKETAKESLRTKIYDKVKQEHTLLVEELRAKGMAKEAQFVLDNQDEILGEGFYDSSVKELIDTLFDLQEEEAIDELLAVNEKDLSKESFENDITLSLSMKVKLLLSGIEDTREDANDNFGQFNEMFDFFQILDALQQLMSDINNNTLESLKLAAAKKIKLNPKEFGFYNKIIERLDALEKEKNGVVNEILYNLYQPKVVMKQIMFTKKSDGTFEMKLYDADSKDPKFTEKYKYEQNFRNSELVQNKDEGLYNITEIGYNKYKNLYDTVINPNTITKESLKGLLDLLGLKVNPIVLDIAFDVNHDKHEQLKNILFGKQALLDNINTNITKALGGQQLGLTMAYTNDNVIDNTKQMSLDILNNNNNRLKDLVSFSNSFSFIPSNMMRLAGKNVQAYEQPKRVSNTIKKLHNDISFLNDLLTTPISNLNFVLNLIKDNEDLKNYIDVVTISLEALKQQGTLSSTKSGITDLSKKDRFITLFNMFAHKEGSVKNEDFSDIGVKLRKGFINFPTLSDASQLPLFKTILLDIQADNVKNNVITDNILNVLKNQLVKGDLLRTGAFLQSGQSTGIAGQDFGNLFITGFSSLNSLPVDFSYTVNDKIVNTKRTLIDVFKNDTKYHTAQGVDNFMEDYKEEIDAEITRNINAEVTTYINEDGTKGDFIENEIFKNDKLNLIDSKYLESKGNVTGIEQARVIAYDYVINQFVQQKEMQNMFAADVSNYFKDSMTKNFLKGGAITTTENIIDFYYPKSKDIINKMIADGDLDTMFVTYPKLKYSSEYITYDVDHETQYVETILPITANVINNMFADVQNNLSKRLKELISPGSQLVNSKGNKTYKQLMIEDVDSASEVLEYLATVYHKDKYEVNKNDITAFKKLDNIYEQNRTAKEKKEHKRLYDKLSKELPLIKGYLKTASTDAQEYTSWKDNLDQLLDQGRLSQEQYKMLFDKLKAQENDLDTNNRKIKKENRFTPEERLLLITQPSKPLYSGLHFETINGFKTQRDIYIKSSSFPILPEMAEQFIKLDKLRKTINTLQDGSENTVVRISYTSANKVGGVKNPIAISELYKDNLNLVALNNSVVELDRQNFYIQQDKPYKFDISTLKNKYEQTTRASQMEKIILGDGIDKIKEFIFPNLFDKELIKELGIEMSKDETEINGLGLKKLYAGLYAKEQKLLKEDFFRKLGIKDFSDMGNGTISAMEKLASELNKRLSNKQDKKALELVYNVEEVKGLKFTKKQLLENNYTAISAEFRLPLFMTPNSKKFESVLNAMVNKNSINLKFNGGASPVASQEAFDIKGYEGEQSLEKLKEQGLITTPNFDSTKGLQATVVDGKLKSAQVFVANKYKITNEQTGKLEEINLEDYVNKETGQLDTTKLPEELLSMFSFRIPTSSHQSGVIIEVVGFLPHSVADLMIVPKDHTVQIGEDYDIDTRYYYQYHYIKDKNGNLKKLQYSDIENLDNNLKGLQNQFETSKRELFEDYFKTSTDTNNPLGAKNIINNKFWYANREKMLEIAVLENAVENYNEDKVLHAILGDLYDFAPIASKAEMQEKINELRASILPSDVVKEKGKELKSEYYNVLSDLKQAYNNEKRNVKQSYYNYAKAVNADKQKKQIIENNIISIYKAVYSSQAPAVQSLINQTLSTDFPEDTAKAMDKVVNNINDKVFNIYSPSNQANIMDAGADGKLGIGVHSNYVTQNSLLQQASNIDAQGNSDIRFVQRYETDENGNEIKENPVYYNIQLGNNVFDGQLGLVEKNGFRISEAGMQSQNSSTDNQKLGIMYRRNENPTTINVFAVLQAVGLDHEGISKKGTNMSYASLFINQPILREYVELVNKYKSITSEDSNKAKQNAKQFLLDKYQKLADSSIFEYHEDGKTIIGMSSGAKKSLGKELTGEKLFDSLLNIIPNVESQLYVLDTFTALEKPASEYGRLQQFINIENGGLGASYFDTIDLMNEMLFIADGGIKISNSANMIGDLQKRINVTQTESDELETESYVKVKTDELETTYFIKPTHHYSHKIVNSISTGYNMWSAFFPYESKYIKEQINSIAKNSSQEADKTKLKYKAIEQLKEYIYSNNKTLFNDKIENFQQQLLFDTQNNKSLASYLVDLRSNPKYNYLFNSLFFKSLEFDINSDTFPSTIRYNSNNVSKINNLMIYNYLNQMTNSNKVLENRNGVEYTEADLMKELLMYSLMQKQNNGATGFRQLLPMELFDKYNVSDTVSKKSSVKSPIVQNIVFNGLTKSIESLLGNTVSTNGVIYNENNKSVESIQRLVSTINASANDKHKTKGIEYVKIMNAKGDVSIEDYNGELLQGDFVTQYFQHNREDLPTIRYEVSTDNTLSKLQKLLNNNRVTLADFNAGNITSLNIKSNDNFIVIKDVNNVDRLYQKKTANNVIGNPTAVNFYEQIDTLGTRAIHEYKSVAKVENSMVKKNNRKQFVSTIVDANSIEQEVTQNTLEQILNIIKNDTTSKYSDLLQLFLPVVDISNVKIEIADSLAGDAQYNYETNVISVSRQFLNTNPTKEVVESKIIEEFLHSISVNTIGQYVDIKDIDANGKLEYEFKEGMKSAPLNTLMMVYQKAIDTIVKKEGLENTLALISKVNTTGTKSNSLTLDKQEMNMYRVSNVHEFLAGVFIKKKEFFELMGNTTYLATDKSLIEKFAETLGRFFYNLLPNKRKDSLSSNALTSFYSFIKEQYVNDNNNRIKIESKFNNEANNKVLEDIEKQEQLEKVKEYVVPVIITDTNTDNQQQTNNNLVDNNVSETDNELELMKQLPPINPCK